EPEPEPAHTIAPAPTPAPRRSATPLVIAGIVTAGLGYLVGDGRVLNTLLPGAFPAEPSAAEVQLAALTEIVSSLEAELAATKSAMDGLSKPLDDRLSALEEMADAPAGETVSQEILDRIAALESRDNGDVTLPDFSQQFSDLETTAQDQQGQIQSLLNELKAKDDAAAENARRAQARTAMAQINAALSSGAPFGPALAELESATETPLPEGLIAVSQDGAPTLSGLQAGIADAARNALAAARAEDTNSSGFSGFVQRQLGLRSVQPKEGDDPDAVLSRVEAAAKAGDFGAALDEAAGLPEVSRAALEDWLKAAQLRLDATQAADSLNAMLAG
ncbi:MAG: hypothetical protein HRU30_10895, partial [Rhodobacteraceae bacterium]|nr:hypothetical protein [Paracoccaceae bacterium]